MTTGRCAARKGPTSTAGIPATVSCGPRATRSRAAPPRSCATSSPTGGSGCRPRPGWTRPCHGRTCRGEPDAAGSRRSAGPRARRRAAVVGEELGRAVAPVPYLGSAIVATTALLSVGGAPQLLEAVAGGTQTAALAVPFATTPGARPQPTVRVGAAHDGDPAGSYRLSRSVAGLADALPAHVLRVPAHR